MTSGWREDLSGSSCCVAVGIASAEYNNHLALLARQPASPYGATGGALSVGSSLPSFRDIEGIASLSQFLFLLAVIWDSV